MPLCSSADSTASVSTDSSSHSVNNSKPSTPTLENQPETMSETVGLKVLQPYEIEEPDDPEPEPPVPQRPGLPCLPDYFEIWQRELADRIEDMDNQEVTSSSAKLLPFAKRDRKRKPIGAAGACDYSPAGSHKSKATAKLDDPALSGCGPSPKRLRRRGHQPEVLAKSPATVSLHVFRDSRDKESSSSDLPSSSGADTADETALADEMDID